MKKLVVLVLLGLTWSVSVLAAGIQYQLRVDGLACPFCAYGVEKKLSSIEGVEDIEVNIEKGEVLVTMKDGSTLSETLAGEKIEKAGFTLGSFSQVKGSE
jgi:mercuric ion binding protein